MKLGLRSRYTVLVLSAISSCVVLLAAAQFYLLDRTNVTMRQISSDTMAESLMSYAESEARAVVEPLAEHLINPLYHLDFVEIEQLIKITVEQSNVVSATLFDSSGRHLFKATVGSSNILGPNAVKVADERVERAKTSQSIAIYATDTALSATHPIWIGSEFLGGIHVEFSLEAIQQNILASQQRLQAAHEPNVRLTWLIFVSTLALVSIFAAGIAYGISGQLTDTLLSLVANAKLIGKGQTGIRMDSRASGEIGELVTAFNEMSENLANSQKSLEIAKEAAEAASDAKSKFLANMSHEIRTPMNGVMGMVEILSRTDLSAKQKRLVTTIHQSGSALLCIINDILDFSKVEAGKLELESIAFVPYEVIEHAMSLFAEAAASKNLEITCDVSPDVPSRVIGDPGRLQQILSNLVSNAIKFTPSGRIIIAARLLDQSANGLDLQFSVADTGIGVAADKARAIFDAFSQADETMTRRFGGTGLGLAIVKQLVEGMGGTVSLQSEPGQGTTITFTVRVQPAADGYYSQAPDAPLSGKRALIISRDRAEHDSVVRCLKEWGLSVTQHSNADVITSSLNDESRKAFPFDIVLLDDDIASGQQFGDFAAIDRNLGVPCLWLKPVSSKTDDTADEEGAYIVYEPIIRSDLFDTLSSALLGTDQVGNKREGVQLFAKENGADLAGAHILVAEDNLVNQEVAREALGELGCKCDIVGDGATAVERARSQAFDLILMDCSMPVMNGFTATRMIRDENIESGSGGPIPIVALTAHALSGDEAKCLDAGMNDHLAKPYSLTALAAKLEICMNVPRPVSIPKNPTAKKVEPQMDIQESSSSPIDIKARNQILGLEPGGGSEFVAKIIRLYLAQLDRILSAIRAGLEQDDADTVKLAAHELKSSSHNVGAVTLASLCQELEACAENDSQRRDLADAVGCEVQRVKDYLENELAETDPGLTAAV